MHAKVCGACGEPAITTDSSKDTEASALQKGAKAPMIARFSTAAGELGAADAERDLRFALESTPSKATGTSSATAPRRYNRSYGTT